MVLFGLLKNKNERKDKRKVKMSERVESGKVKVKTEPCQSLSVIIQEKVRDGK